METTRCCFDPETDDCTSSYCTDPECKITITFNGKEHESKDSPSFMADFVDFHKSIDEEWETTNKSYCLPASSEKPKKYTCRSPCHGRTHMASNLNSSPYVLTFPNVDGMSKDALTVGKMHKGKVPSEKAGYPTCIVPPVEEDNEDRFPVADHARHPRRGKDLFVPDKDKTVIPECHPPKEKEPYKEAKGYHHSSCNEEKARDTSSDEPGATGIYCYTTNGYAFAKIT